MWRFLNRFRAMITGFSNKILVFRIVLHWKFFAEIEHADFADCRFEFVIWNFAKNGHMVWPIWYGSYDMHHIIWVILPPILIIRHQNDHAYNFTIKIDEFWIKNFDVLKLWAFNALQEWKMSETKLNCHNLY